MEKNKGINDMESCLITSNYKMEVGNLQTFQKSGDDTIDINFGLK